MSESAPRGVESSRGKENQIFRWDSIHSLEHLLITSASPVDWISFRRIVYKGRTPSHKTMHIETILDGWLGGGDVIKQKRTEVTIRYIRAL